MSGKDENDTYRLAVLNLWVMTIGKHIFPMILGTETPLSK